MLVVVEMQDRRARDRGKGRRRLVIGLALELDRADKVPDQSRRAPALDQPQQPRRIADHVPKTARSTGPTLAGSRCERTLAPPFDARHCGYLRIQRCLVDRGRQWRRGAPAPTSSHPAKRRDRGSVRPAAASGAIAPVPPTVSDRRGSGGPTLSSTSSTSPLAKGERHEAAASMRSGASSVQDPRGATGCGSRKDHGLCGDMGQLLLDERGAPVMERRVHRPVALDVAQGLCPRCRSKRPAARRSRARCSLPMRRRRVPNPTSGGGHASPGS